MAGHLIQHEADKHMAEPRDLTVTLRRSFESSIVEYVTDGPVDTLQAQGGDVIKINLILDSVSLLAKMS